MGVLDILTSLKDKVLDAAHFELLRSAYELQDKNVDQLRQNNDAIRESNELLRQQMGQLQSENDTLKGRVAELEQLNPGPVKYQPAGDALRVLQYYRDQDVVEAYEQDVQRRLGLPKIVASAVLSELRDQKLVTTTSIDHNRGTSFRLTDPGQRLVLTLSPQ